MTFVNEAGWDRIARIALGIVLLYLGWSGVVDGGLGTVIRFFGFVPLAIGLAGWCLPYAIFPFRASVG